MDSGEADFHKSYITFFSSHCLTIPNKVQSLRHDQNCFNRLFNVIRVNFQNVQIVTKEMSPTSKPQTWNTVVSRPLHQYETDTTLFHCTAILRSDITLKQNRKISNFISSFWHCEFILTCQTLFHLWSTPWLSSEYSHPDCLCTQ